MQQIPNDLPKTKQLLSTIKTASNTTTKYFDLKSQTSENEAVRAVCFSPEKRVTLHQLQQKKSPVKIVGPNYLPKKDSRHLLIHHFQEIQGHYNHSAIPIQGIFQ